MTSPCFGGVRFFTDRFTSELATRKVFRSADADPDQEKPGEDFWLLLTFLANFRVILNSFPFVFLGPQTKILKEETFDSSNNNVVVALAGKVFICLFWDKKVDKKVGWKGMLFRMSKTYNPYSSSFRVYHGQEAVGGGPPCWMWVKHFSGQPVLLVSQTLPTLDCPLEDMDLSFQPCFFFLWSIPPKWSGLKKVRVFLLFVVSIEVQFPGLSSACGFVLIEISGPSADGWFFDQAPEQPPKPFRLPDKFWEPTPLQVGMGRTAWNPKQKSQKHTAFTVGKSYRLQGLLSGGRLSLANPFWGQWHSEGNWNTCIIFVCV